MPRAALSFDDGPGPDTAALLDVLRDATWPATFFVLGRNVAEAPWCNDPVRARKLVLRALREGHVIGNHTYSHAQPAAWRELLADIARADEVLLACHREAGVAPRTPLPFRLPYGVRLVERSFAVETGTASAAALDPRLPVVASLGRTHVHWTSDFDDWAAGDGGGAAMAERMLAHVASQAALGLDAVMDLHDGGTGSSWGYARPATVDAVQRFCAEARRLGITPFTVPA